MVGILAVRAPAKLLKKMKKLSLRLNPNYYSALPYPSLRKVEFDFYLVVCIFLSICSVFLFGNWCLERME